MSLLGPRLTILVGPTVPLPAPPALLEAIEQLEVTHSDEGPSAFQLTARVGRGRLDLLDYSLLAGPLLRPFSRIIIVVTLGALPQVLFDGMITSQQLGAGEGGGDALLTLTGEDVSVMMDLEERSAEHPAQDETVIALKIIALYARFGLVPVVIPPPVPDIPLPTERIPVQQGTDRAYLNEMAARYGYVFYVTPGPAPGVGQAYWGPRIRLGIPQRALSVDMGPHTNVERMDFEYDGLAPTRIEGQVQDRQLGVTLPVIVPAPPQPPLSSQPGWATQSATRVRQFRESGLTTSQAYARATGEVNRAADRTVRASGELDALRYESLLQARGLVGLRGAGYSYDGLYYVERVTHSIRRGEYRQSFSLTRDGLGSITPVVVP